MKWLTDWFNKRVLASTQVGINYTNFEHAAGAVLMQSVIGLITGDWFAGACFGIAFFLGREHAQYQDKIGYTPKLSLMAFDVRKWSRDAQLDLLFPVVATLIVWSITYFI